MRRLRRTPVPLVICVAVAVINAAAWAILTPSFQVPDEPVHAGYAAYVGETGRLPVPTSVTGTVLPEEQSLVFSQIPFSTLGDPMWVDARSDRLHRLLARRLDEVDRRNGGYVAANPPLYYAMLAGVYKATESKNFLNQLFVMRLFSSLLAGLLVGFVFLFVRELLPGWPLAWTVGGLAVALHPMVGFLSGGVSPDSLLWAACAAALWLLARAFRRGLTVWLGLGLGAAMAVGLLTKLAMLTVLPGLLAAVIVLLVRETLRRGADRRTVLLAGAAVFAAALVPHYLWRAIADMLFDRPGISTAGVLSTQAERGFSVVEGIEYVWQFYLPKLPFMADQFRGYPGYPLWETYFKGFVGRFGWFQFNFPTWANQVALLIAAVVGSGAVATLSRNGAALRARRLEILAYLLIALGVLLLVNAAGYRYRQNTGNNFEQTRYLFPLLPFYAAGVALAIRAAGRRWEGALAALLIVILAGHNVFGQLLLLDRYYLS